MTQNTDNMKFTEVGWIPKDWEVKTIGDVSDNYTGLTYSPSNVSEYGTLVLRSSNIQDDILCFDNNVYVNMEIQERARAKEGDILICVRNGSTALIGKSALITPEANDMAFGAFMTVLRVKSIDNKYLLHIWRSKKTYEQIHENFGATINQITSKDFCRIQIPLPSLPEQRRIAKVLSDTDSLISSISAMIEKKRMMKQGTMQQLLSGKTRLKGFDGVWVEKKLGEVAEIKRGKRVVRKDLNEVGQYPVYQNCLKPLGYFDKFNTEAHITFVICGGAAGEIGFSKNRFWAADDCFVVLNDEGFDNLYIFYYLVLNKSYIESNVRKASIPRLSPKVIVDMIVDFPPTLAEQKAIAEILSKMDDEIKELEEELSKYKSLKEGMMQKLLTGQIRLEYGKETD